MRDCSSKVMFEIVREDPPGFAVIYFTELDEHDRDREIDRAMSAEHVFSGFLLEARMDEARPAVQRLLSRLSDGETLDEDDIRRELRAYLAE